MGVTVSVGLVRLALFTVSVYVAEPSQYVSSPAKFTVIVVVPAAEPKVTTPDEFTVATEVLDDVAVNGVTL